MPVLSVILPQRGLTKAHIMRILVILKECIFCTLTVLHQLPKCYTSFSGQSKRYQTQAKYKDTRHGQSNMFPELWIIQQPCCPGSLTLSIFFCRQLLYFWTLHGQSDMFVVNNTEPVFSVLPWESDIFHFLLHTTTVLLNITWAIKHVCRQLLYHFYQHMLWSVELIWKV